MSDILDSLDESVLASVWSRRLGWEPDEWQAKLLDSVSRQIVVNCSRQVGKSQTTAIKVAHTAKFMPGSMSILLAPSERQSVELMYKAKQFIESEGVGATSLTRTRAEFSNGSRIFALPGKEATVRGYSGADLVVIDEASRVPDELYYTIRPMLAVSDGQLILLSTPWGKRGFFHDVWMGSGDFHYPWWESSAPNDGWERYSVPAEHCPRISAQFLKAEERKMPGWFFRQEYQCEFAETQDSVFRYDDITAMFTDSVKPVNAGGGFAEFDDDIKAFEW